MYEFLHPSIFSTSAEEEEGRRAKRRRREENDQKRQRDEAEEKKQKKEKEQRRQEKESQRKEERRKETGERQQKEAERLRRIEREAEREAIIVSAASLQQKEKEKEERIAREEQRQAEARKRWPLLPNFAAKYEVLAELGRGATAKILKVRDRESQEIFAAKMVFNATLQTLDNEVLILKLLNENTKCVEDGVICLYGNFRTPVFLNEKDDESAMIPVLLLSYIEGAELFEFTKRWWTTRDEQAPTNLIFDLLYSCIHAFVLIHSLGIAHRDVKGENIMVRSETQSCVIVDFAFSCLGEDQCRAAPNAGTPCFMSYERLKQLFVATQDRQEGTLKRDQAGDMWGLGLAFYELLVGERNMPCLVGDAVADVGGLDRQEKLEVMTSFLKRYRLPRHERLVVISGDESEEEKEKSDRIERVMRGLLEADYQKRLTAEQALKILEVGSF